jgi:hypothetical protein
MISPPEALKERYEKRIGLFLHWKCFRMESGVVSGLVYV